MPTILLVLSSPRGERSHSSRIATELAERLQTKVPGTRITRRDLIREPLPHVGPEFAGGLATPPAERSAEHQRALAASDHAVEQVLAADTIVIAAGMINFAIPSTLKSWLDHVARSGLTFRYGTDGPEGLVRNRKVYLVVASGGVYSSGPAATLDHATPYLRSVLAFMGMTDVEVIRIEGVTLGAEAEQEALDRARQQLPQGRRDAA